MILTTCTARKSDAPGRIPARARYRGARVEAAAALARARGRPLVFLSGVYGVLPASAPIPWYDHALQPGEVAAMTPTVARQLTDQGIARVLALMCPPDWPGWAPYHRLLGGACAAAGVALEVAWTDRR